MQEILEYGTRCQLPTRQGAMGCLDREERGLSFISRNVTEGVGPMEDKEKKESEEAGKKKQPEPLPFCTNAPSAEHGRGTSDDEPCDDSREGR